LKRSDIDGGQVGHIKSSFQLTQLPHHEITHIYNSKVRVKSLQKCRVSASARLRNSQFIIKFFVNSVHYNSACTTILYIVFTGPDSMYSQACWSLLVTDLNDLDDIWGEDCCSVHQYAPCATPSLI